MELLIYAWRLLFQFAGDQLERKNGERSIDSWLFGVRLGLDGVPRHRVWSWTGATNSLGSRLSSLLHDSHSWRQKRGKTIFYRLQIAYTCSYRSLSPGAEQTNHKAPEARTSGPAAWRGPELERNQIFGASISIYLSNSSGCTSNFGYRPTWSCTLTMLFRWWNLWKNRPTWLHCDVNLICWNWTPCKNQSQRIIKPLLVDRKMQCSTDAIWGQRQEDISESLAIVQKAGVSTN